MGAMFPPEVENQLKEAFFPGSRSGYFVEIARAAETLPDVERAEVCGALSDEFVQ